MNESREPVLLATPQRQLPVAIVAEFFGGQMLRQLGEALIPALVVSFAAQGRLVIAVLPLVLVIALATVVLRWWRTTFWVENDELILERGVLSRTKLQVPLDRVQQIVTEQGIIQQLFDVRRVTVDTAGSVGAEFSLSAVSNDVVAELRLLVVGADRTTPGPPPLDELLPGQPVPDHPPSESDRVEVAPPPPVAEEVVHLSIRDLVQVGLVRPGGQVLSAVVALFGFGLGRVVNEFIESQVTGALAFAVFATIAIILAAIALIGGAVVRDYDLTVWRSERGLRMTAGLFTKREQFARTERVQLVRRRANPLERLLDRTTTVFGQATGAPQASPDQSGTKVFLVPSVANALVDDLTGLFIADRPSALDGTISPLARRRWSLWGGVLPASVFAVNGALLAFADQPVGAVLMLGALAMGALAIGLIGARAAARRWRWALTPTVLSTRHGVLIDQTAHVEIRKIQSVTLHRGWWHRRNGLATIECSTAGGVVSIPHLPTSTAESMRDRVLAEVQRSGGPWM